MTKYALFVGPHSEHAGALTAKLERGGFRCTHVRPDDTDALTEHARNGFDVVVADGSSAPTSPSRLSRELRLAFDAPIIMLCEPEQETEEQIAACLESGADECLSLAASARLLLAHVTALLRRPGRAGRRAARHNGLDLGQLKIDLTRREVSLRGQQVELCRKEFDLLVALAAQDGVPVSAGELLRDVWGYDENCKTRTLGVHIARLRAKLEVDPKDPKIIITVPRFGYKLRRLSR